jgi:hypothetical protein
MCPVRANTDIHEWLDLLLSQQMLVRGATTMRLPPDTPVRALYLVSRLHFILELQLVTKFVS